MKPNLAYQTIQFLCLLVVLILVLNEEIYSILYDDL